MKLHTLARPFVWIGGSAALLVLGLVLALSFDAPEPELTTAPSPSTELELPAGTAALRVAIDPETGTLVPDHSPVKALDADLENMLSRSSEGLKEIVHPDGHVSVHLEGRFMSASLARVAQDGTVETTCVENSEAMDEFLNGVAPAHSHAAAEVK